MASSKLSVEEAVISVTRAIDMSLLLLPIDFQDVPRSKDSGFLRLTNKEKCGL
jgi:hypothetical protein